MANTADLRRPAVPVVPATTDVHDPTYQAFQILHVGFAAAPIFAGATSSWGY